MSPLTNEVNGFQFIKIILYKIIESSLHKRKMERGIIHHFIPIKLCFHFSLALRTLFFNHQRLRMMKTNTDLL